MVRTAYSFPKNGEIPLLRVKELCVFAFADYKGVALPFFTEYVGATADSTLGKFQYLRHDNGGDFSDAGTWTRSNVAGTKVAYTGDHELCDILMIIRYLQCKSQAYKIPRQIYNKAMEAMKKNLQQDNEGKEVAQNNNKRKSTTPSASKSKKSKSSKKKKIGHDGCTWSSSGVDRCGTT